ncbi:MAG: AbrB/MazE/SpoVT family DNA-binding domain-containing protein [Geminicoccaceae bacterium]|nr:AbrB/MazE/SpoVT family DNA-binding domain-containing protein [Geminicoccaceae bacterium]
MSRATLTSKGQITIPKEIRDQLRIDPGCRFEFYVDGDRRIVMVPLDGQLEDLIGSVPHRKTPLSVEDVDRAIVAGVLERARLPR